jgi:6-phosphofructokinase 1
MNPIPTGVRTELPLHCVAQEFRYLFQPQIYIVDEQEIESYFRSIDHPFQTYPPNLIPDSLHTFDPLGTLIGFVAKHHPFSSNIHAPPKTSTIAQTVSSPPIKPGINATVPNDNLTYLPPSGKRKRIGVMTSGGDSPGMNAVVRAVARMAMAKQCESYAIHEGYEGLVQGGKLIKKISWEDVRGHLSEVTCRSNSPDCSWDREGH